MTSLGPQPQTQNERMTRSAWRQRGYNDGLAGRKPTSDRADYRVCYRRGLEKRERGPLG